MTTSTSRAVPSTVCTASEYSGEQTSAAYRIARKTLDDALPAAQANPRRLTREEAGRLVDPEWGAGTLISATTRSRCTSATSTALGTQSKRYASPMPTRCTSAGGLAKAVEGG